MQFQLQFADLACLLYRHAWFAPRTEGWIGPTASLLEPDKLVLSQLGLQYLEQLPAPTQRLQPALAGKSANDILASVRAAQAGRLQQTGQWPEKSWRQLCQPCLDEHAALGSPDLPQELQTLCSNCGFHPHARTGSLH